MVPPRVVQGELHTKEQAHVVIASKEWCVGLAWESLRVFPEAFCDVLSSFPKVPEALDVVSAQFHTRKAGLV